MLTHTSGNIIAADVEALVNTVNCEGLMGKGIALQFKRAFPANFRAYERACRAGQVRIGRMFVFETHAPTNPRVIINFPTKEKWREGSKLEYIDLGLKDLIRQVRLLNVRSIAVPPLGSGLGGLNWSEVRPRIERAFAALPDVNATLFEPTGAPEPKDMPTGSPRPALTAARALLIKLMANYRELAYRLTLLEIQKLAYFLQITGERLRLQYVGHTYGPYAHNLNKVLEVLEGHYTVGYGDQQKPDVEIDLLPGAAELADRYLEKHPESRSRLNRVAETIRGFETPYGMELLASVHWAAVRAQTSNADAAIQAVHSWNDRKRLLMKPEHIRVAWLQLQRMGLIK
ncbi:MAG: type II toxin-antitoxin system antitoxin DNA ADP-ribosyl glycohydrolase DarG [Candidatus Limnocylindria bacterium]